MSDNMNFIGKWCHKRCGVDAECGKCTVECKPRSVLSDQTCVSEHLLRILQNQHGGVTHPKIADRIADFIGATPEERDSIVHKKHRGTYTPNPKNPALKRNKVRRIETPEVYRPNTPTSVIAVINSNGRILATHNSLNDVAIQYGCNVSLVRNRCEKSIVYYDEFSELGVSFRYYEQWKDLSDTDRKKDVDFIRQRNAENRRSQKAKSKKKRKGDLRITNECN